MQLDLTVWVKTASLLKYIQDSKCYVVMCDLTISNVFNLLQDNLELGIPESFTCLGSLCLIVLQKLSSMTRVQVLQHVSSFKADTHPMVRCHTLAWESMWQYDILWCLSSLIADRTWHPGCLRTDHSLWKGILMNREDIISLKHAWLASKSGFCQCQVD